MKRRREQEKDEAIAREQADARREALLAELKARQAGSPAPEAPPQPAEPEPEPGPEPEPEPGPEPAAEPAADEAEES